MSPLANLAVAAATPGSADVAWVLVSTALVLLMTPGLALFYGGLVRAKNVLNTMMMSLAAFAGRASPGRCSATAWPSRPARAGWAAQGTCCSAASASRITGGPAPALLRLPGHVRRDHGGARVGCRRGAAPLRPLARVLRPLDASRVRARLPLGVGGGWLARLGALDFAGGTVVHVNAGTAALVAALVLGSRRDWGRKPFCRTACRSSCWEPASCGSAGSGSTRGSALGANDSAVLAFATTLLSPMATLAVWMVLDRWRTGA